MTTERMIRRNGKWTKITGRRGEWRVAQGWEGSLKAVRVFTYPTKEFAIYAAISWLND
jgi:hypothetical protein